MKVKSVCSSSLLYFVSEMDCFLVFEIKIKMFIYLFKGIIIIKRIIIIIIIIIRKRWTHEGVVVSLVKMHVSVLIN